MNQCQPQPPPSLRARARAINELLDKLFGKEDIFYCTPLAARSVHEKLEVDPSDPGIAGVVAHVPRPQPAGDPDQHSGGQVVELHPHHRAATASVMEEKSCVHGGCTSFLSFKLTSCRLPEKRFVNHSSMKLTVKGLVRYLTDYF